MVDTERAIRGDGPVSATGSFDRRAIDGADGARPMQAFKRLVERPLAMLA